MSDTTHHERTRSDDDRQERDRAQAAGSAGTGAGAATCRTTGRPEAAAVERARKGMLHEARDLKRTRIGADVLCEALLRQGVDVFFSYPGGVILPLYDVLGDYPELRHVLVRHEQGGAHAADGYARVTGRVGVCMGTSGPGATNLVTGIGTALLDSVPMVAITGNVPGALIGKDAFQEIDINGITLPMTKHNYLVRDADDLPRVVAEAFHIARTGRPGPGPHRHHQGRPPAGDARRAPDRGRGHRRACPASARTWTATRRQLKLAAAEIAARQAAGHPGRPRRPPRRGLGRPARLRREDPDPGRLDAARASARSTRPIRWPTATWACTAGSTSTGRSRRADLLIAIGMRFDDRVTGNVRTYAPYARIVHVDIDPAEIGKNVAVEVPIVGDAEARPRRR